MTASNSAATASPAGELRSSGDSEEALRLRITELELSLTKLRADLAANTDALDVGAAREQELRQRIAELTSAVASRDVKLEELTVESSEMRSWIQQLQKQLVNATSPRPLFRLRKKR